MKVAHESLVEAPAEAVWRSLADVDGVLTVLPGATLTRDGDSVAGSLRCLLGTSQVTYRVVVRADVNSADRVAILAITGKEARGTGVLAATITVAATRAPRGTSVRVSGEIEVSGRGAAADARTWQVALAGLLSPVLARPLASIAPPDPDPAPAGRAVPVPAIGAVALVAFGIGWRLGRRRARSTGR
ncbi:MAG TPA: SRPBCC family protein [Mycobacteriales bacterium]|nr:SRPBCC family protein [Mycobacteriales bacterium]